jgi:hypothetical protein
MVQSDPDATFAWFGPQGIRLDFIDEVGKALTIRSEWTNAQARFYNYLVDALSWTKKLLVGIEDLLGGCFQRL